MLLLVNPGGDLCFDFFIAGDECVVAFEDFVLHEGVDAVSFAPLFGVLNASLERISQRAMVGQMALIEGVEQGVNYWFHIGLVLGGD